jgi:hypothetical protein
MNKLIVTKTVLLIFLLFLNGCGSSTYLLDTPRKFESCINVGDNIRQKSFDTIFDIVNRKRGWIINNVNKKEHKIKATVTRGRGSIPMLISVNKQGAVEFIRDPGVEKEISNKWSHTLKRWLDGLEANYSRKRCI